MRVKTAKRRGEGGLGASILQVAAGGARIVTFNVKDLEAARSFYVDRLGLPVDREEPGRFVMVRAGKLLLCIDREDDENRARGGGASLLFRTASLDKAAAELGRRGVPYTRHAGGRGGVIWRRATRRATS